MRFSLLLLPLSLTACEGCSSSSPPPLPPGARLVPVAVSDLSGLSGLARDDKGALWAVPETKFLLLQISPSGAELGRFPLSGVPEGAELESLAWLGEDRFAIGTEGGCKDGAEKILLVTREEKDARTTRTLNVPLSAWGATCDDKRGLEGLCAAGGKLVAALENPLPGPNGERHAAIARIDEATGDVTALRLALTSDEGKISGLDCRAKNGAIEVLAIERHFTVSRLLSFSVPESGPSDATPIKPTILVDLAPYSNEGKRNFEGAVWIDDTHAALIVDNHYRKITGPNELVEVDLPKR